MTTPRSSHRFGARFVSVVLFLVYALAFGSGNDAGAQAQVAASIQPQTATSGTLGAGTTWETPWYVIDSGHDGPTVLITGGVHGNEPAGYRAAEQIRDWPISRGKLVVMPQINRLGLAATSVGHQTIGTIANAAISTAAFRRPSEKTR